MYLIDNHNKIQNAIKYIKLYSRKSEKQPWLNQEVQTTSYLTRTLVQIFKLYHCSIRIYSFTLKRLSIRIFLCDYSFQVAEILKHFFLVQVCHMRRYTIAPNGRQLSVKYRFCLFCIFTSSDRGYNQVALANICLVVLVLNVYTSNYRMQFEFDDLFTVSIFFTPV